MPMMPHGMDQVEFYEMAMKPDFPDTMQFEVTSSDEDAEHTFSMEAMGSIAEQIKNFILARLVAYHDRTGDPVKHMTATVRVEMGESDYPGYLPFYTVDDDGNKYATIDGMRRLPQERKSK